MKYFIIAGEASGDLHASNLMRELKVADPQAQFHFSGGDLMEAEGGKPLIHYRDMAFMGILNVLFHARTILRNFKIVQNGITEFQPHVVILVDYPSFNLRIAEFVKKNTTAAVYYYIPPKIWAWKEYRIKSIKKYVDKVFTIFPFETDFYNKHQYKVDYIGNPTVDTITDKLATSRQTLKGFCSENNLPEKPIIALLPGSRRQEIKGCLPRMIKAAKCVEGYQVVISGAPGVPVDFYSSYAGQFPVVFEKTYQLLNVASAAVVNSGTATLETALAGIPEVVVYHIPGWHFGYLLKQIVVRVKYISLVNLIAGKEIVKELYAHKFTADNVYAELNNILFENDYRSKMLKGCEEVKSALGESGAAKRAAEKILNYLKK
jgi:lipid-A-disaccharide synthase